MIGELNVVAKYYLMSMWYVGTPVMLLYIIINAFIGAGTIADAYRSSDYGDDIDAIYPPWTTAIGKSSVSNTVSNTVIFQHISCPSVHLYQLSDG